MTWSIVQPPVIDTTLEDLISFWHNGVNAAHVNIMYATVAAGAGVITPDTFAAIASSQQPLLFHIDSEIRQIREIKDELSSEERFSLSTFAHDIVRQFETMVKGWSFMSEMIGDSNKWLNSFASLYSPVPTLQRYFQGLADSRLLERSRNSVDLVLKLTGSENDLVFADLARFSKARIIFENLVDNAIKYGKTSLEIELRGNDLIFEDGGIGMDPAFAARLGKVRQIRESRAEGVQGDGIGWASIGRLMNELGWSWEIETSPGQGTKITIHMKEGELIPVESTDAQAHGRVQITEMVPADEIIRSAVMFTGARPFQGYDLMSGPNSEYLGRINIVGSPIFPAIMGANVLAGPWMGAPFFMPSCLLP